MSTIERVAKAIWLRRIGQWVETGQGAAFIPWESVSAQQRVDMLDQARAAIAALREPTEPMVVAGLRVGKFDGEWQAMIDAALAETPV
jgi:hypothetical protein